MQIQKQVLLQADVMSSRLSNVEVSEDYKRAVLTIPLFHVGANDKGLFWTEEMLKKIVPLYQGIPFRYDLGGQEGSSHTLNKLSSPFFDVGWTYDGSDGAWYDPKTKALWVKGEVTHPEVVQKLSRATTKGVREVNYASMGAVVEKAECSICEREYGTCEHERLKPYNGKIAYKVPTEVSKGLHVALTNDPADGEAEISECVFQEMGGNMMSNTSGNYQATVTNNSVPKNPNQIPGGLAPSSPITGQPGAAPSPQEILTDIAERIKTLENKVFMQPKPEVVNSAPQDQFTQDNMGTMGTQDISGTAGDMQMGEEKKGQTTNASTPVNPKKPEMQDMAMGGGGQMAQVVQLLQQAIKVLSGGAAEMQDMGKESLDASKSQAVDHHNSKVAPTEHEAPGDAVSDDTDESNKKNKAAMMKPGEQETADNAKQTEKTEVADNSEVAALKKEVADMSKVLKALNDRFELQDSSVPEFGGTNVQKKSVDVADMSASERHDNFGEFGKWDACFNGAASARRFSR